MTSSVTSNDLVSRLRGWVAGFDRHEHVSTWVARELMAEAIEVLDQSEMAQLRERLLGKLHRLRGGLEALRELTNDQG